MLRYNAQAGSSTTHPRQLLEARSRTSIAFLESEAELYTSLLGMQGVGTSSGSSLQRWTGKGKGKDKGIGNSEVPMQQSDGNSNITDTELALRLAYEEATALAAANADYMLALRMAELQLEMNRNAQVEDEESPWGSTPQHIATMPLSRSDFGGRSFMHQLSSYNLFTPSAVPAPEVKPPPPKRLTGHDCVACQDSIRGNEVKAPCGHYYDEECVLKLFHSATHDESLFPPRCCQKNVPLNSVRPLMPPDVLLHYEEKAREFGILKRVYCSDPKCSRFLNKQLDIGPGLPRQYYNCPRDDCTAITCARCKASVSPSDVFLHNCVPDQGDETAVNLGKRSKWARCPGCAQLIELNYGCYHMVCLCKTEFCYLCQAKWKTCSCEQWDEERLVAPLGGAVRVGLPVNRRLAPAPPVRRAPPPPPPPPPPPVPPPLPAPAPRPRELQARQEALLEFRRRFSLMGIKSKPAPAPSSPINRRNTTDATATSTPTSPTSATTAGPTSRQTNQAQAGGSRAPAVVATPAIAVARSSSGAQSGITSSPGPSAGPVSRNTALTTALEETKKAGGKLKKEKTQAKRAVLKLNESPKANAPKANTPAINAPMVNVPKVNTPVVSAPGGGHSSKKLSKLPNRNPKVDLALATAQAPERRQWGICFNCGEYHESPGCVYVESVSGGWWH